MGDDRILACDVGGTRLRVAVVETGGVGISKEVIPTPKKDPDALTRAMRSVEKGTGPIVGAVVGLPGLVDYSRGEVLTLPNLPDWEGTISAARLGAELGVPVLLANDADLAALGEHRYGAGRGSQDMLYMTSSTGVGAGVIISERLLHGRLSLAEAGHTIIDWATGGTLESLGSGTALARAAGEDAAAVADKAAAGDPVASQHFASIAEAFAVGVLNLVHSYSPEVVVIGGGMSQAGELLLGPVRERLKRCGSGCVASKVDVVKAQGDDDGGLRGAYAYWLDCSSSGS